MEGLIGSAFATALEANRERYNQLFAQARRSWPKLDGPAFLEFLDARIDPLVDKASGSTVARAVVVVDALYALALEMFRLGLVGPQRRYPEFELQWTQLMFAVTAADPCLLDAVLRPLSNALFVMTTTPEGRSRQWSELMRRAIPLCADAQDVLRAGQVAAWLSGLAHYRSAGLELCTQLGYELRAALLGLPAAQANDRLLGRMRQQPWLNPTKTMVAPALEVVAEVGRFRGFGGQFFRPPRVFLATQGLCATDGFQQWLLTADAFGATLHPCSSPQRTRASQTPYRIRKDGQVQGPTLAAKFDWLSDVSSQASDATTLAITLPHSHHVYLVSELHP